MAACLPHNLMQNEYIINPQAVHSNLPVAIDWQGFTPGKRLDDVAIQLQMSAVKDGEPNGFFVWCCPFNPVLLMCQDIDLVASLEVQGLIWELQPCLSFSQEHPFVLILVVPVVRGRLMPLGNDALNFYVARRYDGLHKFSWQVSWNVEK